LSSEENTPVQANQWRLWIPGGRHPEVDFGVERHTLVTGEIIQIFHRFTAAVIQVQAARAHLSRLRACELRRHRGLACPDQGESRDSLPTQLRGRQGAPFETLLARF
jgi:hypothetical protein